MCKSKNRVQMEKQKVPYTLNTNFTIISTIIMATTTKMQNATGYFLQQF